MSQASAHGTGEPSAWVRRWAHLAQPGGSALDVACGHGRHMAWLAAQGFQVTGLDRSEEALSSARAHGHAIQADLENAPWPLLEDGAPRQFDLVVVTNYLWRTLFPTLLHSLAPGGVLLYETFAAGNETVGKPSRPDFLLQPGELLHLCQGLNVVAYENGFLPRPERFVQRIAAVAAPGFTSEACGPSRYPLSLE
ncbi:class I SAM-dependent methyltransferase [Rhodoferax sp. U2-2l]|uniref:class I SAM-dependent methyltransferase n=1 Tax=Rhodoferax sp. U2-2l TaxID=2884000 RepID=UPI001D0A3535|nr:class I SAM-dependent methyltransferase [Rhodoferax sp. U2-2l]MCB8748692.1 class I SAM-dependent methyltransferase [Rhodoferax sp. U2-2l]